MTPKEQAEAIVTTLHETSDLIASITAALEERDAALERAEAFIDKMGLWRAFEDVIIEEKP